MKQVDWEKEPGFAKAYLPNGTEYSLVMEYDGRKLPTFEDGFIERITEIRDKFVAREDDILVYGYMKSGKLQLIRIFLVFTIAYL